MSRQSHLHRKMYPSRITCLSTRIIFFRPVLKIFGCVNRPYVVKQNTYGEIKGACYVVKVYKKMERLGNYPTPISLNAFIQTRLLHANHFLSLLIRFLYSDCYECLYIQKEAFSVRISIIFPAKFSSFPSRVN